MSAISEAKDSSGRGDDRPTTWGGAIDDATLDEIDELLDAYWAAWDDGDGDAVLAVMAAGGLFASAFTGPNGCSGEELVSYVGRYASLRFSRAGPTTVIRTSAGYEVAGAERVDEYTPEPLWALDHFVIVEEDGRLRIASHRVISAV